MEKLAIFDVDYTITRRETLMEFFKFCVKEDKRNLRFLPRITFCGLMFILGIYDERKTKERANMQTYIFHLSGLRLSDTNRVVTDSFGKKNEMSILWKRKHKSN